MTSLDYIKSRADIVAAFGGEYSHRLLSPSTLTVYGLTQGRTQRLEPPLFGLSL
jgi:hypothetical protein